ncbi:KilA-N domain-containing protein [Shewanella chilikensis]|uniref:KilA-N domain-containing protein n=1 Tax=Shewanella chilikensis TaxID=558541 RepID=UPI00200BD27C|nr:KilA-N domain-containing protein [Shewanella chilikensis]MCL1161508.1 KilA-N domain-containing protein [Shewanella chilikensis]
MKILAANPSKVIISDIAIRQDDDGRYSLNDLHQASGGEKRHQPSDWLKLKQTIELVGELLKPGIPGISVSCKPVSSKRGRYGGTYVCKELVYSYAMWISAAFSLKVIRAYDALVSGDIDKAESISSQTIGTDGFRCLGAVLEGKVRHLPRAERKRIKHHIWSQVHKAFSVVSAQDIPAESLDSARNFIAAYSLEGELLPRGSDDMRMLVHSANGSFHHWQRIYKTWISELEPALRQMRSPIGAELRDHVLAGMSFSSTVKNELEQMSGLIGFQH